MAITVTLAVAQVHPTILNNLNPSAPNYFTSIGQNAMIRLNGAPFHLGVNAVTAAAATPPGPGSHAIKFTITPDRDTTAVKNALRQ